MNRDSKGLATQDGDKATRIRKFLKGVEAGNLPLVFSETGHRNLASRFGISTEELTQHIAAYRVEAGRNG